MSDHAPSVAAPASLREAGQALSDAIADMAAERRLFVDAAVRTDIHFLDALKAFRAALRAESVAAPAATEESAGGHQHDFKCLTCDARRNGPGWYFARHAPPALDAAWAEARALPEANVKGRSLFLDKSVPGRWYANIRHENGYVVWYMPGDTPEEALRELVRALNERAERAATPASGEPAWAADDDGDHSAFTHRDDDEPPPHASPAAGAEPPR